MNQELGASRMNGKVSVGFDDGHVLARSMGTCPHRS
jgi:hypothetical protein